VVEEWNQIMKPNIFIFCRDCPEDFFSRSLAYIANLFPAIGQSLIQRIAVLAGKAPDYFGVFEQCEFVGQELQDGHTTSKPDLKILCSDHTIFFENKLDSPLSLDQMQRHATFICRNPKCSLIFVSNIQHKNTALRTLPGYLRPEQTDHYLWTDFLPVFAGNNRRNSLASKILADFDGALKANGMIGRKIRGADGSLYTSHSDASHLALTQLRNLLIEVGFKVTKKSHKETTLRVYPVKYLQYPLLNPRFEATSAWLDEDWDRECLDFTVVSLRGGSSLDRQLGKFHSTKTCAFIVTSYEATNGYHYHGHFVFPLGFIGRAPNWEIDFGALKEPLMRLFHFLKGVKPLA
jgi:hypothetical protein